MPRILLVDDDPAWRNLYRMALESKFDLFEATDGYQALSVLGAVRPDVIVLDLKMPRMTGIELLARIAELHPLMARVLLSGFTEVPEVQGALDRQEIQTYVLKPIDSERLRAAVNEAIAIRRTKES